jgi:SH3-like domain-containing protein
MQFMKFSRRQVLAAAAGMRLALAQVPVGRFVVASGSGLRMERHGDPQRPAVSLFLPETKYPSAIIEMPEHAWRKEKADGEQAWFYKMYTSDRALRGDVTWLNEGSTLSFSMKTPSGFVLNTKASLEVDGIAITHEVISNSVPQLAAVEATTCVKLYRPFTDVFLERTYVHHPEGLELIASETADRFEKNAEEWLPCRYIARVGKNAPPGAYRAERVDGVTKYFKSRAADAAFLATESHPGGWTAATHAVNCESVFTNPARTCHHADPRALAITDGRAVLQLKVYVLKGTPNDLWNLVAERERAGKA